MLVGGCGSAALKSPGWLQDTQLHTVWVLDQWGHNCAYAADSRPCCVAHAVQTCPRVLWQQPPPRQLLPHQL